MKETIIKLTKSAFKNEIYQEPFTDEKAVFKALYDQGLTALTFNVINKDMVSKHFYERSELVLMSYIKKDLIQQEMIKIIKTLLNEIKVDHIFLKGAHLKKLYKESYYRGMGDIDFIVREKDYKRVHKLFLKNNFKLYTKGPTHYVYLYKESNLVEVHHTLKRTSDLNINTLFSRTWEFASQKDNHEYMLDPTFELTYLVEHLSKHIQSSGVGIRSVLDISIFYDHYYDSINREKLHDFLKETNHETLLYKMLLLNNKAFGFESIIDENLYSLSNEEYNTLIDYFLLSGIHGTGEAFNFMAPRAAKKSKLKTLLIIMFPSWTAMKEMYPFLRYIPILLPFMWVWRWLKLLIFNARRTFGKVKQLKDSDEASKSMKEVYDILDL